VDISRAKQDRETRIVGAGFLVTGVVATAILWKTHLLGYQICEPPLGAMSLFCALSGAAVLGIHALVSRARERRVARGEPEPPKGGGLVDRLAVAMTPRNKKAKTSRNRDPWKRAGIFLLLVALVSVALDEGVARHRSWTETTCRLQARGGDRVRATYNEGIRTLSFEDHALGTTTGSVRCYVMPGSKYGTGTLVQPTGARIPRGVAPTVLFGALVALALALLGVSRMKRNARVTRR